MTILYKVESKDFSNETIFPHKVVLCAVSTKNIIAFSALHTAIVSSSCADIADGRISTCNSHVYICDIVIPWQYYKVCSSNALISVLEWSANGEQLLLGYDDGRAEIWQPKNYTLNVWQLQHFVNIPSEDIINAKFFHNGKTLVFNPLKKDLTHYGDKFERSEHRPTVTGFGGVAKEGCVLITASGLLVAFSLPTLRKSTPINTMNNEFPIYENIELTPTTHSIGTARSYITHSSILPSPSGALNIAISCGWQEQVVHCFTVSLKPDGDYGTDQHISIKSETQACVFLNPLEGNTITQLKWVRVANEDVIFITYACTDGGSLLEQWNLTRRHQSVHALLQLQQQSQPNSNKAGSDFMQCESWEHAVQVRFGVAISDICISHMAAIDCVQLYVILKDNTVQILESGTLKMLNQTKFDRFTDAGTQFLCGNLSPTHQILLIFDSNAQLYAMQTPLSKQSNGSLLLMLLEYCIVTGIDAIDIIMLNLCNIDALVEKLSENFTRQPAYARQYYYSNFLTLKSNLCRVQQDDFDNLITLHAMSTMFKSLLRPSDLGCQDKGPADNLTMKLADSVPDVDTVLLSLDAKDFTVEPMMLQSLQQLIQWVTDLALNMLNRLPEEIMKSKLSGKRPCYDISRDIVAIGSMRELLVMIRIWGLLNAQCQPVYTKTMDNIDVLSILFRLLTRLAQNTSEPDEMLLDECSLLSKQVLIPRMSKCKPTTLLSPQGFAAIKSGLVLTSLIEPIDLREIEMEEVMFSKCIKDGVSNIFLGAHPKNFKQCPRCGFINGASKVAKTPALKAWCNKWQHCHCGGFWIQIN